MLHLETQQSGTWRQLYRHLLYVRIAPEKKSCDRRVPLSPSRKSKIYAEEQLLFEDVSVDSDIVGATTSGRGGQSSLKWSGKFSTKECGEPSHVMLAVSWRARLSQMFAQSFHVRWRLVFFLSGSRLFLYSFAFGVFSFRLSFVSVFVRVWRFSSQALVCVFLHLARSHLPCCYFSCLRFHFLHVARDSA